jgi:very-short-patch-repair endonuclease
LRGRPIPTVRRVAARDKVHFAREQRREPTRTEDRLWELLRDNGLGFKIRRQHPFRDFVLDFYCQPAKLCVESTARSIGAALTTTSGAPSSSRRRGFSC